LVSSKTQLPIVHSLDRPDKANNVEMLVVLCLLIVDFAYNQLHSHRWTEAQLTILVKLLDQARPFPPELVGTGQTSVSTTHGQAVDAEFDEVMCGLQSAFTSTDWQRQTQV
jgi:hypothetical protein